MPANPPSPPNKKDALVRKLIEGTRAGKIVWKKSAVADAYEIAFPKYTIQISQGGKKNNMDLALRIFNEAGEIIEEILDGEMAEETGSFYFEVMHELLLLARRSALGSDKAIDDLLTFLD
jgi:hypothetical protein